MRNSLLRSRDDLLDCYYTWVASNMETFSDTAKLVPFDARLKTGFGLYLVGPPASGKTWFALSLIENANTLLDNSLDYITWFFGERGAIEKVLTNPKIKCVEGLPENLEEYIQTKHPLTGRRLRGLFVFDDLMNVIGRSEQISQMAANKCHHADVSWIVMLQNPFSAGKHRIDLARCAHYMVLYKNPLDKSIARYIGNKIMPQKQKTFMNIYEAATAKPNGYLFIDGKQDTPEIARLRTDLFNAKGQTVFVPIDELEKSNHVVK